MTENWTGSVVVTRSTVVVAMFLLLGLGGCSGDSSAESQSSASEAKPSVKPLSMPTGLGDAEEEITPGRYRIARSEWSAADFAVTFPEGWSVQYGHVYHQNVKREQSSEFYAIDLDAIYTDSCHGEGVPKKLGRGVDGLVDALLEQKGTAVGDPVATTVGGHPATRLDLEIPKRLDLRECRLADDGVLGLQLWYSASADKYFVLQRGGTASVYVLDVDGDRQVFVTQQFSRKRGDRAEVQAVLDSIRVG